MGYNGVSSEGYSRERGHGAQVRIGEESRSAWEGGARVYHETWGSKTYPTVRSYRDGIRIGCTFVTNEAFRKIWDWHKEFLDGECTKTHQEGDNG